MLDPTLEEQERRLLELMWPRGVSIRALKIVGRASSDDLRGLAARETRDGQGWVGAADGSGLFRDRASLGAAAMKFGKTKDAWRVWRGTHRAIPLHCPGDQVCVAVTYHGRFMALRQNTHAAALEADMHGLASRFADELADEADRSRDAQRENARLIRGGYQMLLSAGLSKSEALAKVRCFASLDGRP